MDIVASQLLDMRVELLDTQQWILLLVYYINYYNKTTEPPLLLKLVQISSMSN